MPSKALLVAAALLLAACGSGTKGTTVTTTTAGATDSAAKDTASKAAAKKKLANAPHHAFDTAAAAGARPLERESYKYESAALRDPFKAYVEQVDHGPELADLRLVAVLFDAGDQNGSIATFRDIGNDHRYTVSPGQRLGRISVVSVTASTVKLRMDDFGTMRDQTYSLRKPEDQKP